MARKFQYKVVELRAGNGQTIIGGQAAAQQDVLDRFGAEGWDLVAIENHGVVTAYFKREVEETDDGKGNPEASGG